MEINATLWGQMITFAIFVWFTMKFVWPMLEEVLKAREKKIAEGLEAADRGHRELEISQKSAIKTIREAREQAEHTLELARKQAAMVIETAKRDASFERDKIMAQGIAELEKMVRVAREGLHKEIVNRVIDTTEKLLHRSLTEADQKNLLEITKEELHG